MNRTNTAICATLSVYWATSAHETDGFWWSVARLVIAGLLAQGALAFHAKEAE